MSHFYSNLLKNHLLHIFQINSCSILFYYAEQTFHTVKQSVSPNGTNSFNSLKLKLQRLKHFVYYIGVSVSSIASFFKQKSSHFSNFTFCIVTGPINPEGSRSLVKSFTVPRISAGAKRQTPSFILVLVNGFSKPST